MNTFFSSISGFARNLTGLPEMAQPEESEPGPLFEQSSFAIVRSEALTNEDASRVCPERIKGYDLADCHS